MYEKQSLLLDIPSRVKTKIISVLSSIPEFPIVLILDSTTSFNLASCVQLSDLHEVGVFLIEDINKKRKPFPHFCAVYMVSYVDQVLEAISSDWQTSGHRYKSGYIFYTESPSDAFWEESRNLRSNPCIKSITESFLSFQCTDAYSAHMNMHLDMVRLLSHAATTECHKFANKLFHALESLGYAPSIRYQVSPPARQVAQQLETLFRMERLGSHSQHPTTCELLIVDRSIDVISPIAHDFSYEKVFQDLCADYAERFAGKNLEQSHWDPIWTLVRYLDINSAQRKLMDIYSEFRQKHGNNIEGSLENQSTAALAQIAHETPAQQRIASGLEIHMTALKNIYSWLQDAKLSTVFEIEQIMIQKIVHGTCGLKSDEIDRCMQELSRMTLPILVRQRVLYIYALTQHQGKTKKLELLMDAFKLPKAKLSTIERLQFLHERGSAPLPGTVTCLKNGSKKLDRFPTKMKQIATQMLNSTLSTSLFPYVHKKPIPLDSQTILLCIVGGFTTAEVHDMHQLRQLEKRPIILMSSSDVRPKDFLYELDLISL